MQTVLISSLLRLSLSARERVILTSPQCCSKAISLPEGVTSLLSIVESANNFVLPSGPWSSEQVKDLQDAGEQLVPFFVSIPSANESQRPIGFVRHGVVSALIKDNEGRSALGQQSCWDVRSDGNIVWAIGFADWVNASINPVDTRTAEMDRLLRCWRAEGNFNDRLKGDLQSYVKRAL